MVRPLGAGRVPVAGVWAVLHRVGPDTAGPIDSVKTGHDGSYVFRFRPTGSDEAIYFISAEYRGIAYFAPSLRASDVRGDDAEITVFDTTSAPIPLQVRGRHLVVSSPRADGTRELVEVYELSNDSSVTRISPDSTQPTWTATVPDGATNFRVGQGDISGEAMAMDRGRVRVVAPFAPGVRQLSFAYILPPGAFPLSVPVERGTTLFEVLVEDSAATVTGASLAEQSPVSVEGRTFKRFLAQNVAPNAVARISLSVAPMPRRSRQVLIVAVVLGAVMLIALALSFRRRPRAATPARGATERPRGPADAIAREIAQLDAEMEARTDAGPDARSAYQARRDELKRQLAGALDAKRSRV